MASIVNKRGQTYLNTDNRVYHQQVHTRQYEYRLDEEAPQLRYSNDLTRRFAITLEGTIHDIQGMFKVDGDEFVTVVEGDSDVVYALDEYGRLYCYRFDDRDRIEKV